MKIKWTKTTRTENHTDLKAPYLESIIKSQRIMCCKKFAENQQSNWKIILSHYMKNVGSKLILSCAFDLKKLCIQLPKYYEECFRCFAEYSVANKLTEQALSQEIHNTVIWNNKFICIQGKSVFREALFKKGIITLEDLTTDGNDVITGFQIMASASFTPKEKFQLTAIIDAILTQWRNHLKMSNNDQNNYLVSNSAQLCLNGHNICYGALLRTKYRNIIKSMSKYRTKYRNIIKMIFRYFVRNSAPQSASTKLARKKHLQRSPLKGRDYTNRTVEIFGKI